MVGQVVVDRARGDRPRSDEGERRERLRVVERGNLGDHPADADARQVRRPDIELAGECRSVGGKITQRVRRRLGIDGDRRTGIAQVIAHDVTPAARERLAERVGPESMVVPPAHRTSGAAASPKCSTPSVTPFASTVVMTELPS